MNIFKASMGRFLPPKVLYVVLAVSVVANASLVVWMSYSQQLRNVFLAMQSAPTIGPYDHVRGDRNAKATVIVFTDYQCPYCSRLHAMMQTLAKDSDFRLVYRHFPLEAHQVAERAAEAAECASEQNQFWEYSDSLFKPMAQVSHDADLTQVAENLGLNMNLFSGCLLSGRFGGIVAAQHADGLRRGLMAVPTLFVNGKRVSGVIPVDQLKTLLLAAAR